MSNYIPQDDAERKAAPMFRGLLGYFPAALFEVAVHSLDSDLKHGAPPEDAPHWMRGASTDHEDTIIRHLIDAGPRRTKVPGMFKGAEWSAPKGSSAKDARRYHLRCIAWRALALLQEDCEADGAAPGMSSVFAPPPAADAAPVEVFKAGPFSDRFAALKGSDEEQQNPPRRVFRVYRKSDGGRSGNYPATYHYREDCERALRGNLIGRFYEQHRACYEIREEDE